MSDQWMIRGKAFGNCNCAYGCPCQFGAPTTNGFCQGFMGVQIEEGNFNDTSLDGLNFVMLLKWPGEIAEGNGEQQMIIDEGANAAQRDALNKIGHGESTGPGGLFFIFSSTFSKVHETLYKPITINIDIEARRGNTKIDGIIESVVTPLINPFTEEEERKGIHLPTGFEYTYAEMGSGTSTITGAVELELEDSYGQFNILHQNQDGIIHEPARVR